MAKPKKFDLENPAPVVDDEDEETLAATDEDEGMRDAEAGRTVPCRRSPTPFSSQTTSEPHHRHPTRRAREWSSDGAVKRCARLPRRPSKLPQNHFQRSLTT